MHAWLDPPASSGPCTVLNVEQSTIPPDATWFRLRRAEAAALMPAPIHPDRHCGSGFWFLRTPPKPPGQHPRDVQQLPFQATGMFNAGLEPTVVPVNLTGEQTLTSYVVEAWTDRSDLGVTAPAARLLATSAILSFSFDDLGFSRGLQFHNFSVSEVAPGWVTVRAQPSDAQMFRLAQSVTWAAFQPTSHVNSRGRPLFSLDTSLLNDKYDTDQYMCHT